jgi:hypothetical protein
MDQINQMEQRCVVRFLPLKSLSKNDIHYKLITVLLENAVLYSSVTNAMRFCKKAILILNSEDISLSPKDNGLDEIK